MTITASDGAKVTVTEEHPFYVAGLGWVMSGDLKLGDQLAQRDGSSTTITAISVQAADTTVYNFTVEGDHNYYVTEAQLLVHNCAMQSRPGALAQAWGYSTKQIRTAIERVKQQPGWRGGASRNPDVFVDDATGEVFPRPPDGTPGQDSIGNLYDFLPEEP